MQCFGILTGQFFTPTLVVFTAFMEPHELYCVVILLSTKKKKKVQPASNFSSASGQVFVSPEFCICLLMVKRDWPWALILWGKLSWRSTNKYGLRLTLESKAFCFLWINNWWLPHQYSFPEKAFLVSSLCLLRIDQVWGTPSLKCQSLTIELFVISNVSALFFYQGIVNLAHSPMYSQVQKSRESRKACPLILLIWLHSFTRVCEGGLSFSSLCPNA